MNTTDLDKYNYKYHSLLSIVDMAEKNQQILTNDRKWDIIEEFMYMCAQLMSKHLCRQHNAHAYCDILNNI